MNIATRIGMRGEPYYGMPHKPSLPGKAEFPSPSISTDPAEHIEFSRIPAGPCRRLDTRTVQDLQIAMFDLKDPVERERAAWEYADRIGVTALGVLRQVAKDDPDSAVRSGTLWLIQRVGEEKALAIIDEFLKDDDPEVADWADLLARELKSELRPPKDTQALAFDDANIFNQTLPLTICGHARTFVPGAGWFEATLSPKWFERIMGRVMACTRSATFTSELVIEKRIKAYHPDGSDHFEIYPFRGFTYDLGNGLAAHYYQSETEHTFYPSGKVEDLGLAPIGGAVVNIQRAAVTARVPTTDGTGEIIDSVRGRYMGAAYVNLQRVISQGMTIGPGEVQLSTFHHPSQAVCANTHLFGAFKGKLSDLNGDGRLDINIERSHSTIRGELDYDLDGIPDRDPFDPLA